MFFHRKELIRPVNVGEADARFGTFPLKQFRGATGELTAALHTGLYPCRRCGDPGHAAGHRCREFSYLEMVGKLMAQHTGKIIRPRFTTRRCSGLRAAASIFSIARGSCLTAAYINEGGNVVRDLRANIAADADARQISEVLIKACDDTVRLVFNLSQGRRRAPTLEPGI